MCPDDTSLKELKSARRLLLDQLQSVDSASALLSLQLELADAIMRAEAEIAKGASNSLELHDHIQRLRKLADGGVWMILHPHAIRQLAKNEPQAPSLIGQGDGFANVLDYARQLFDKTKLPILICDITNVLSIGDLLLVNDLEEPMIVECKSRVPDTQHLMQGRTGRQLSRALRTVRYMAGETINVYGENYTRGVIETDHEATRHWAEVEEACATAVIEGMAFRLLSAGNWLWAAKPEFQDTMLDAALETIKEEEGLLQFGLLAAARKDLYPPPCVWPIETELRHQLSEGDLLIFRIFDLNSLASQNEEGIRIEVRNAENPIVVTIGGEELAMSPRFVNDAVYGFETVESVRKSVQLFARQAADFSLDPNLKANQSKPAVHSVVDVETLRALVGDASVSDDDIVAFPAHLLAGNLIGRVIVGSASGEALGLVRLEELRKLPRSPV